MAKGKNYNNAYFNARPRKSSNYTMMEVDNIVPGAKGMPEGALIDIDECGIDVRVLVNTPSYHEVNQFKSGKNLEVKLLMVEDIIFFLMKFGDLPWIDIPYNVNLSSNPDSLKPILSDNEGYATTITLIDTLTGRLRWLRLCGMKNYTSKTLYEMVKKQKTFAFNINDYNKRIQSTYSEYTTEDLVRLAEAG